MSTPTAQIHLSRRKLLLSASAAGLAAISTPVFSQTTSARPLKKFKVQDMPNRWNGYELLFLAQQEGLFKQHGIELELVQLPIDQYTIAVQSGVTDFALSADYIYFANIRGKNLPLIEVASTNPIIDPAGAGDGLFVLKDSPIKQAADLKGKKIAVRSVAFSAAWFTIDYLRRAGIAKDEVQLLTIPDLQLEQVLQTGAVDAVFAYGPIDGQLRKKGSYRQLFQISDLAGRRIQRGGSITREAFIKESPDVVRAYVAATADAIAIANKNPKSVIDLGVKLGRIDPAVGPYLYTKTDSGDYSALQWPEQGLVKEEDVAFWLDIAQRQALVPQAALKASDLYTNAYNPYAKG
ncbi:hypothetical protein ASB57_07790 [Bordetella sp. N]|nr:hypothetical protein ASB57_07790 [Bordetella sp. N]